MPAPIRLNFACGLYDRMLRLYTGEVKPEGIDLTFTALDEPRDIFDRMAGRHEFDMAEMSSSESQPLRCQAMSVRGAPGVRLTRVPARLHFHQS